MEYQNMIKITDNMLEKDVDWGYLNMIKITDKDLNEGLLHLSLISKYNKSIKFKENLEGLEELLCHLFSKQIGTELYEYILNFEPSTPADRLEKVFRRGHFSTGELQDILTHSHIQGWETLPPDTEEVYIIYFNSLAGEDMKHIQEMCDKCNIILTVGWNVEKRVINVILDLHTLNNKKWK